jgi:integrase
VSTGPNVQELTLADAARMMREAVKDQTYREYPLGQDAAAYLWAKRKRLTASSYRDYEGCLDKLARYFLDLQLADFEPPVGTRRVEEFLDAQWSGGAPRTYNKNLSIVRDFFKWAVLRGELHGDPTLPIERARSRQVYRTTFNPDQIRAIIASQDDLRDRIAVRLLLDYGLRKGALTAIQFKHFDHYRRRLTIFTKGEKVREVPIPSKPFWFDLERLVVELEAKPNDYLMCRQKTIPRAGVRRFPDKPLSGHGMHSWWYRCPPRPESFRRAPRAGSGCIRPATPPASASSTPPATSRPSRSCSGTHRSRPPAMCTPIGTSSSSPRRWSAC